MVAFVTAFTFAPILIKYLNNLRAGKQIRSSDKAPVFAKLHQKKEGTPTMGGVLIWGTVVVIALFLWAMSAIFGGFWDYLNFIDRAQTYLPLAAMVIAGTLGAVDDVLGIKRIGPNGGGLRMRDKLVLYLALAFVGALWFFYRLDWDVLVVPLIGQVSIGWFYIPLFIFIITASAHSANVTDGLDGLAGGVLLFAFIALTVVAFALGRYDLATFGGVVIGALLAFLWFNINPAKFFMGDTGSMALGITMGVIAMLTNTTLFLPFFAPILVLESASVIVQLLSKKVRGKKIFYSAPIHHHFEALGWPESQVTMRFWIISAIFSALGLALFFLNRFF